MAELDTYWENLKTEGGYRLEILLEAGSALAVRLSEVLTFKLHFQNLSSVPALGMVVMNSKQNGIVVSRIHVSVAQL